MSRDPDVEALCISECAKVEAPHCRKMLLLGERTDGSTYSFDTGLTADEATQLTSMFIIWVNNYLKAAEDTQESK